VDVTSHPNIGQLPSISECGFPNIVNKVNPRKKRNVEENADEFKTFPWTVGSNFFDFQANINDYN